MIVQHHLADDATCPGCGIKINGATPIKGNSKPTPGDLSVCSSCGCLLQFTDAQGHCQHLPADEFKALPKELRKELAFLQGKVMGALKGGRL